MIQGQAGGRRPGAAESLCGFIQRTHPFDSSAKPANLDMNAIKCMRSRADRTYCDPHMRWACSFTSTPGRDLLSNAPSVLHDRRQASMKIWPQKHADKQAPKLKRARETSPRPRKALCTSELRAPRHRETKIAVAPDEKSRGGLGLNDLRNHLPTAKLLSSDLGAIARGR